MQLGFSVPQCDVACCLDRLRRETKAVVGPKLICCKVSECAVCISKICFCWTVLKEDVALGGAVEVL